MLRRRFLLFLILPWAYPSVAGAAKAPVAPLPAAPVESRITVPITLSLRALFDNAESRIPREISSGGAWAPISGGPSWARMRYTIGRGPLSLSLAGTTLRASTEVTYSLAVKRTAFPVVTVSAGTGDEPPRRARLDLQVDLTVTPGWQLQAISRVRVEPIDRCKLNLLHLDVTDRIREIAEKELARQAVEHIDRPISASTLLRDEAARAWARVQSPMALPESLWLCVQPARFGISAVEGAGDTLRLNAHLACGPRILAGTPLSPEVSPLPEMSPFAAGDGDGFRVLLDGTLDFEEAGRLITLALATDPDTGKARVFRKAGFAFHPTNAKVEGAGDHIRLTIAFAGSPTGKLVLTGRPRYDPATQCLCADDLSYTLETRNLLARLGMVMFRDTLRHAITRASRWPVQGSLNLARERLDAALNRPLAEGARLSGKTRAITPLQVETTPTAFRVRALLEGDASLEVTPELPRIAGDAGQ